MLVGGCQPVAPIKPQPTSVEIQVGAIVQHLVVTELFRITNQIL